MFTVYFAYYTRLTVFAVLCYNTDSGKGGEILAVSDAKKKANAKWDSENMATLACKVKRAQATAFKSYCMDRGQTSNTALKDYVLGCIGEHESQQEAVAPFLLNTLKIAQEAARAAGEDLPQFLDRAVTTQAQRDALDRKMEGGEHHGN